MEWKEFLLGDVDLFDDEEHYSPLKYERNGLNGLKVQGGIVVMDEVFSRNSTNTRLGRIKSTAY